MPNTANGSKMTQSEIDRTMAPLALDLESYYEILQEEQLKLIRKASREGWTGDELIQEIEALV